MRGHFFLMLMVVLVMWYVARHLHHVEFHGELTLALDRCVTFVCAFPPALGASMAGIENQGEFARIHKRSHAMANSFRAIAIEFSQLSPRASTKKRCDVTQEALAERAHKVARLIVDGVADWRVMFKNRPQPDWQPWIARIPCLR